MNNEGLSLEREGDPRRIEGEKNLALPGILPIAKSGNWDLVGHGSPYHDCGKTLVFGCDNVEAHTQAHLDEEVIGKVFIKLKRRTCLRAECPICYEKWAAKEAHKIAYRQSQYRSRGQAIHVVFSVPSRLWHISLEDLRPQIYKLAKKVGLYGGSVISHPYRQKCQRCGSPKETQTNFCSNCGSSSFLWEFSPHFHAIGKGWILGNRVTEIYKNEDWIIKNLGIRISIEATAFYQLSHAGYKKDLHVVTWFGSMAYTKMKIIPEEVEKDLCPLCNSKLKKMEWIGFGEMPFKDEGDYFDDPKNWISFGSMNGRFQFSDSY